MDIDFKIENNRFIARCEAIIFNSDKTKVLLFNVSWRNFYMLPGGRINFFETSEESIKREIYEELGLSLDYKLYSINEIIDKRGIMQYTFTFTAIYDTKNYDSIKCLDNDNQYFDWIDINKLDNIDIKPIFSKELIVKDSNELCHFIEYVE